MKKLILALLLLTSIAVGAESQSQFNIVCDDPRPNSDGTWRKVCVSGTTYSLYTAPCYYCVYTLRMTQTF